MNGVGILCEWKRGNWIREIKGEVEKKCEELPIWNRQLEIEIAFEFFSILLFPMMVVDFILLFFHFFFTFFIFSSSCLHFQGLAPCTRTQTLISVSVFVSWIKWPCSKSVQNAKPCSFCYHFYFLAFFFHAISFLCFLFSTLFLCFFFPLFSFTLLLCVSL